MECIRRSVLVSPNIYVLQCLHAVVDTMTIIRKLQRSWYLKTWDTITNFPVHWTLSLSYLSVYFSWNLLTLWVRSFGVIWIMISDPRSLTWFIKGTDESLTREDSSVPLMHQWSWITHDPDPDNPKEMHPLSLLNFLLKKNQGKIVHLVGTKIISNVTKHYSTYDSLNLYSDIVMRLSFFPQILPFTTP